MKLQLRLEHKEWELTYLTKMQSVESFMYDRNVEADGKGR